MVVGLSPIAVTQTSDIVPVLSKEFLDIQAIIECGFLFVFLTGFTSFSVLLLFLSPSLSLCMVFDVIS